MINHKGLAEKTAYLYATKIGLFAKTYGDIEGFTPKEVASVVSEKGTSPSDHNSWVSAINKYQEYCKVIGNNAIFTGVLGSVKGADRLPKPLSEEEIDSICNQINMASLQGKRDRVILELLYCGLRNQETCNISLGRLEDETILVRGKGNKDRYVPINIEEIELAGKHGQKFAFVKIKERLQKEEVPIFLTSVGNKMYPREVRRIIKDYAVKANVLTAHPHRFRHSFATHTLDSGLGNLTALKDVLGHKDFDMVQRYVLTTKIGRERVKSFHPRQRRKTTDKYGV
jgi:site-specific recombinase XerD